MQSLTPDAKKQLLRIARESIAAGLQGRSYQPAPPKDPGLLESGGVFVTLHVGGALRGCIGLLEAAGPLYLTVASTAHSAAFNDPRFSPMRSEELDEIDLEISVLSPMKRLADPSEITVGRHGLYIVKGAQRGVLLPQVATEQGWDRVQFLEETCRKAGIPRDAWKTGVEINAFSAVVFGEKDSRE